MFPNCICFKSRRTISWIIVFLAILTMLITAAGCTPQATPIVTVQAVDSQPTTTPDQGLPPLPVGADPNAAPPGDAGGPPKVITPTIADIPYASVSSTQVLDLYIPTGAGPFPVVVNIHPGGFFTGQKDMVPGTTGKALLAAGYAIASINYRLSDEAKFPAAVQDAKAAVRFLRANAAKYNLNPNKIAAFGQSAGGNIAAMLGTSAGVTELEGAELGNSSYSSKVQAVIDWFGPTDFTQMDTQAKVQGCSASDQTHSAADSPESKYLGAAVPSVPDLAKKANPITYINKDTPPFLIQKGDQDCTVPIESTKMLADALSAASLDVHYDLLKNVGHGDGFGSSTPVFESDSNSQNLVTFLNTKLDVKPQ